MESEPNSNSSRFSGLLGDKKATWIILAGIILFFLPEPITSVVGTVVLAIGLVFYLVESVR